MKVKIVSNSAFKNQVGDATPISWGNDASKPSGYMVKVKCATIGGGSPMKYVFFFVRECELQ